jgi:processive 1,2-diacylglycerol beta-glucosyltransferase
VLILTASIGEGHDLPARTLGVQLRSECPAVEIKTVDCLTVMGRTVARISEGTPRVIFYRFTWLWDVAYWMFAGFGPTRRLSQALLSMLGSPGLLTLIAERNPDVVVSVYPAATEVLGRARRKGRLDIPVCAAITDVSALHYWASPGADIHLVTHVEAIDEVGRIVGPAAPVHWVHGFTAAEFLVPRSIVDARKALGIGVRGKLVVVSGGGWGVGDVRGAVEEVLGIERVTQIVCLCGRNEELRVRLAEQFAAEPRVRVEPFTERMSEWLAAADVLIHSTGGLTVLEALMRGCPAISYGWGRGHLRVHNAAFRRYGLAEVAVSRAGLREAVDGALDRGRTETDFSGLPSAASFVLAAAVSRASRDAY